jgi:O-antigen ligase
MITVISNKINLRFYNAISILCACLVPLLVTGPTLPDLIISFLSTWFLYYTLKNKIYYIYKNIYFYFFIGFWLVCILSSILSDNFLFSLKASFFYIRIGIFALLIFYLIDQNKKILDYFYYSFIITFSFLIIDGYFQYFVGSNLFGYSSQRVSSFFGSELILGSYLTRLFPLLYAIFIVRSNKHNFEVYLILSLFILIYILIFITQERAAFFLFNLSNFFIIILISNYKFLRIAASIISLCLIFFASFKDERLHNRYIATLIQNEDLNTNKIVFFTIGHDSLMKTAWNMFLDKPILGHGPKMFRVKCSNPEYAVGEYPCDIHPHNFYFQLLAETGIIGFSFLAGIFCHIIYLSIKHIYQYFIHKIKFLSDYQICLLSGFLITIWPLTTNGNFFTNYLMLLYGLQMGFFRKKL